MTTTSLTSQTITANAGSYYGSTTLRVTTGGNAADSILADVEVIDPDARWSVRGGAPAALATFVIHDDHRIEATGGDEEYKEAVRIVLADAGLFPAS